ncbi:MOSC domain protein [Afipia carboxidovorans OM5]|uniref:MOSC domain protein n=1 Tax=Afipia carboxidovorans (strain ATCC 49405 / DSM 1227 / KCTC 32145 / OM5) TaxID=504832 RepID=F8C0T6_AFIC5|nr:MOSC domain-containing protein [Afipia carboxidovorans]AEI04222.1 MOSC domain protein [Afipia carboxidovorans OM4]AEI07852.1 MOSC domain protein [Afipia carboxidovorans OM5]
MLDPSHGTVAGLYRYPVKGLSAEALPGTTLLPGQTVPCDRRYAIENGPIGFDPEHPRHFPKLHFLMLMRHERLATLQTRFDDATDELSIVYNSREAARGNLETAQGRAAIEDFFAENFTRELRGPPKILSGPNHSFSDAPNKVVSIVNLASVAAVEEALGAPLDPMRLRANVYVQGWPAWCERGTAGCEFMIGETRLRIERDIVRCAAVNVDLVTAERDLDVPATMQRTLGHQHCGVYAEVIAGGDITPGDPVRIVSGS